MDRDRHDEMNEMIEVRDALRSPAFQRVFWSDLRERRGLALKKLIKDTESDKQRGCIDAIDWIINGAITRIEEKIKSAKALDET